MPKKGAKPPVLAYEGTADPRVKAFLERTGAWSPANIQFLLPQIRRALGEDYQKRLEQLLVENPTPSEPVEVRRHVFRDIETARFGWLMESPGMVRVMEFVAALDLPAGDVIDLGCGGGLLSCFIANLRPDDRVVGVDIEPASLGVAKALASELGLTNVEFVEADLRQLDLGGKRFAVAVSSLVAHETDSLRRAAGTGFSTSRAVEKALASKTPSPVGQLADSVLGQDGMFLAMERIIEPVGLAEFLASMARAGFSVDLGRSTQVRVSASESFEEQLFPLLVFDRQNRRITADDFMTWWLDSRPMGATVCGDLVAELRVKRDRMRFVRGWELQVEDEHGKGRIRMVVLKDSDGAGYLYKTTSRGARAILEMALPDHLDDLVAETEENMKYAMDDDPDVVRVTRLTASADF